MTLQFDGADARANANVEAGVPQGWPFAICGVAKLNASWADYGGFFQHGHGANADGITLEITDTRQFELSASGDDFPTSTGVVPTDAVCFIGLSSSGANDHRFFCYNLETRSVVFNEANTDTLTFDAGNTAVKMQIGCWASNNGSYTDFFFGHIYWVGVYALDFTASSDYFMALAHLGPYAFQPTNVFTFMEDVQGGTSTNLRDRVAGNTLTLNNFAFDANDGWRPLDQIQPWWLPGAYKVPVAAAGGGTVVPVFYHNLQQQGIA